MNRFRLSSSDLFIRKEEGTEKPSRIVFLSVEGNSTEVDYLKHLNRNKERLGIKSWVEIEVLGRKPTDTRSDPDSVLELLEEFVSLYNKGLDENRINSLLPQGYSIDMVKQYVEDPDTLPQGLGSNLQERFNQPGIIDLAYYRYLINKKGEDDYFGIIIDRDSNSHPQQQLERIFEHCRAEGYLFFLSNPCFEFWLLLHLCDVKTEYEGMLELIRENRKISSRHSYISNEVSRRAGHRKEIRESKFKQCYLDNIDNAVRRAEYFESDPVKLIKGEIGCNIQDLIKLLRGE